MTAQSIAGLEEFASGIASANLSQADSAIALLWLHDHHTNGFMATASELNKMLADVGLRPAQHDRSLKRELKLKRKYVLASGDKFKLTLTGRSELGSKYMSLLKKPKVIVSDTIVPEDLVKKLRKFYAELALEINGQFKYQFYDGCLVLIRRMVESLIVDLFEKIGHADKIKTAQGEYMMLNALIGVVCSGQYLKLAKGAKDALEKIKEAGDKGAHNRFNLAVERDVQNIETGMRAVISELIEKLTKP
jgi:hypothetical protein